MLNTITLMGRLVADPEMRRTTTGKSVASFRLACDRGYKDANGQSLADFFSCVAWAGTADFLYKYFHKGNLVALTGRLQSRQYTDKDGNRRTVTEVVAGSLYFTGERTAAAAPAGADPIPAGGPDADDYTLIEDDGDLPF